jgi:hypothetical protein
MKPGSLINLAHDILSLLAGVTENEHTLV